jgi:general secretion pathway protein E/type IV pilus assembly protein PilB
MIDEIMVSSENQHLISGELANHYKILPKESVNDTITLFVDESFAKEDSKEELELFLGKKIDFINCSGFVIERALSLYYRKERTVIETQKSLKVDGNDFLENLLHEAKSLKSSDIHFEIYEESARIRFRIDGQLIERYKVEKDNYLELVNKVKIKSKLNIT